MEFNFRLSEKQYDNSNDKLCLTFRDGEYTVKVVLDHKSLIDYTRSRSINGALKKIESLLEGQAFLEKVLNCVVIEVQNQENQEKLKAKEAVLIQITTGNTSNQRGKEAKTS